MDIKSTFRSIQLLHLLLLARSSQFQIKKLISSIHWIELLNPISINIQSTLPCISLRLKWSLTIQKMLKLRKLERQVRRHTLRHSLRQRIRLRPTLPSLIQLLLLIIPQRMTFWRKLMSSSKHQENYSRHLDLCVIVNKFNFKIHCIHLSISLHLCI